MNDPTRIMTKRYAAIGPAAFLVVAATAQPVITATDAPAPGYAWNVLELANLPPLASGASATWNLTGATITGTRQLQLASPASAPGASNFPNATVVANADGGSPYNFLQTTSSELRTLGLMNPDANVYTDPLTTMVFPCSLGSSWSDSYANAADAGTRSYIADAYGTLIGPNGTLSNVLRIHSEYTTLDTVLAGVTYQGLMVEDAFWKAGTCWPVATSFWYRLFTNGVLAQEQRIGSVLDITNSVGEHGVKYISAAVWPNPAQDQVQLEVDESGQYDLIWMNTAGQEVIREKRMLKAYTPSAEAIPALSNGPMLLRLLNRNGAIATVPVMVLR